MLNNAFWQNLIAFLELKMKKIVLFLLLVISFSYADPIITSEMTWEDLSDRGMLEIDGNNISIFHPKDVISYTRHLNDESYLANLSSKYDGCKNVKLLNKLLKKQDYIEILNHVWTEKNYKKRIAWLEKKAKKNHPILMLELAYAYILDSPTLDTYVTKSLPWLQIGTFRIEMDACCSSDESVKAASSAAINYEYMIFDHLQQSYSLKEIEEYHHANLKEELLIHYKVRRTILEPFFEEKKSSLPSPSWVFAHGLHAFSDEPNKIAKEDWDQIRKKIAFNHLEIIYIQENQYRNDYKEWLRCVHSSIKE